MEQPQYASLHFENLSLKYKEDLPLVLKGISFEIQDGEKVGIPQKLDTVVDSSIQLFSSGQKQLLCLTRALVQKRSILILDEPTSFVDMDTDKAVHKCIQEEFQEATIFTIAHRISTIANYDKIIVM